jgi:hypothetical protein
MWHKPPTWGNRTGSFTAEWLLVASHLDQSHSIANALWGQSSTATEALGKTPAVLWASGFGVDLLDELQSVLECAGMRARRCGGLGCLVLLCGQAIVDLVRVYGQD